MKLGLLLKFLTLVLLVSPLSVKKLYAKDLVDYKRLSKLVESIVVKKSHRVIIYKEKVTKLNIKF